MSVGARLCLNPAVFKAGQSRNPMMKIKAVKYFNEIRLGSSLPLVVGGDDNNLYVVKLNGEVQ